MNMQTAILWISIYFAHLAARHWIPSGWLAGKPGLVRAAGEVLAPALFAWALAGAWMDVRIPLTAALGGVVQLALMRLMRRNQTAAGLWMEAIWLVFAGLSAAVLRQADSFWLAYCGAGFYGVVTLLAGWTVSAFPAGALIGLILRRYPTSEARGFDDGGKTIGMLERSIILLLFLLNAPVGVGFLITAKTLFRFGEISKASDQKHVEYILIGTLLSFLLGMLIALLSLLAADIFFPAAPFKLLG